MSKTRAIIVLMRLDFLSVHQNGANIYPYRRSNLLRTYSIAKINGDEDGAIDVAEMVRTFNLRNPDRKITRQQLLQSVRVRRRRINDAEQGVYLSESKRGALDAGRFALPE